MKVNDDGADSVTKSPRVKGNILRKKENDRGGVSSHSAHLYLNTYVKVNARFYRFYFYTNLVAVVVICVITLRSGVALNSRHIAAFTC